MVKLLGIISCLVFATLCCEREELSQVVDPIDCKAIDIPAKYKTNTHLRSTATNGSVRLSLTVFVDGTFKDSKGYWQRTALTHVRRFTEDFRRLGFDVYLPDGRIILLDTIGKYDSNFSALQMITEMAEAGKLPHVKGDYKLLLSFGRNGGGAAFIVGRNFHAANFLTYAGCFVKKNDVNYTSRVVLHEVGHLMGSPHTHACAWNGNRTRIDNCGNEGNCISSNEPGCIMSYCQTLWQPFRFHPQVLDTIFSNMRDRGAVIN